MTVGEGCRPSWLPRGFRLGGIGGEVGEVAVALGLVPGALLGLVERRVGVEQSGFLVGAGAPVAASARMPS